MIYKVDLTGVDTPYKFHKRVREVLPVPEWYGKNLDALYDVLTEQEDITVQFYNMSELKAAHPRYAASLERLCNDCGAEII